MSGEAPAYLTVGTAVSAKYRGAFCEAKVKIINKRLVKCRINFKDNTNAIVPDEHIKGTLKIGSSVEAKHPTSGNWQEGVITKLNDASSYTVLFDDGDEKTLGRSSLCLQGEKHFHESETLDHLPLTDPENFGTPVVRDRTKRKRINPSRTEDDSGESSEGSEVFKRLRREEPDNAVGKVVIVETNEKRKNLWFPALIVDPSCTKDAPNRTKDHIVTRSFKDNKYYTVSESSWRSFASKDHLYKGDVGSLKSAVEKAVLYIETGQLPSNWDFNLLKSRDKLEGESEGTESSDESSDDEYDEEKDAWLASLHKFMEERGTPINKPPVLGYRDLNLYKLYKLVQDLGGCRKVTDKQQWRYIASKMGIPIHNTSQCYNIKASYNKYLFAFEDHNRKLGPGIGSVFTRTRRRSSYDRWPHVSSLQEKKETTEKEKEKKKEEEEKPELEEEEVKTPPKKKTRRKPDVITEQEKEEEDDSERKETPSEEKEKKENTRGAGKRTAAKSTPKEGTEVERDDNDDDDDDFGPDFEIGERVKVQYGRGRTHKVYEAKIVDVQGTEKNAKYSVHYLGWNVRYDEVVTFDRIVQSLDNRKEKRVAKLKAAREKEKEQKQREEKEKKEKEKKEKERKEKEAEKVRKEKEKREKEEKEKKEKEEREREKKEKKEREEQEKKLKKEQEEREKREKKEKDEKERKEKKERERKKEKEEQERREKEQQERLAAEQLALEEKQKKEKEEKAKLEEKTEKNKQEEDKGKVKGTSKRGRPPSLSPKTSGRPSSPRVPGGSKRSPAASLYQTRSLRSDRNSLSESPFANGLEALKPRSRRGSSAGKAKAEQGDSGEESEDEPEADELPSSGEAPSPDKLETKEVINEEKDVEVKEEPKPLEPVPEETLPLCEEKPPEEKLDLEMPVFDTKDGKDDEGGQPPKSPPKLKKEGEPEENVDEVREEEKEVKEEVEESEGKKGKRRSKKGEKEGKQEKESKGEKKTSKRRHSKDVKPEAVEEETVNEHVKEESKDVEEKSKESVEDGDSKELPKEEASSEEKPEGEEKKKKGRKRGRKSLEEKGKVKGEKKAKKGDGDAESGKRGRRQKKKHGEEEDGEDAEAKSSEEQQQTPGKSKEDKPKADEKEENREMEPMSSDSRMLAVSITTPPTTPESSGTGTSSPNEDEGHEEGMREGKSETIQTRLVSKSDSDSVVDMASSGSSVSVKNDQLDEVSSSNSAEKTPSVDALPHQKRGRPNKDSAKKRRKHSDSVSEHSSKAVKKSKRKKESRRRTTSISSSVKQGPSSSDTDDSSNAENKLVKANVKHEHETKSHHQQNRIPKPCKYNFSVDVSHMSNPDDRISMIQNQLIELRKIYLQLKSEVTAIDRRRKRYRRKEREAQAALAAATSLADISNSAPASSAS